MVDRPVAGSTLRYQRSLLSWERAATIVWAPSSDVSGRLQSISRGTSASDVLALRSMPANAEASAQTALPDCRSTDASRRRACTSPTFVRPEIISGYDEAVT